MKRFETVLVDYDKTCRYYKSDINKQFPYYNRNGEILREVAEFENLDTAAEHYVRLYPRNVYGMFIRQVDESCQSVEHYVRPYPRNEYGMSIRHVDESGQSVAGGDFLIEIEPVGFDAFSDEKLSAMYAQYINPRMA